MHCRQCIANAMSRACIKTTRSGCADTAGTRCLNQSSRCRLTLVWRRSAATSDFFMRIAELAKELADRIRVRAQAGRVMQGRCQFRHRDVTILHNDFRKEHPVWIEFSFALGAALRCGASSSGPADRPCSRTCGR